jgi:integrase
MMTPERACQLCGASLARKRKDAQYCGVGCRSEASRLRRLLSREGGIAGYPTWAAYDRASRRKRDRLSPKTVNNHLNFLHGVFAHALKRGWTASNPVEAVERPRTHVDPDIRYLELVELEAVIRAVPDDALGQVDGVLYLAAAMTGLRMGELAALRWRDVDWTARQVRVRRSFTRGDMGTPKSHGSNRGTPLSDRLAGELERHFQRSQWQGDDDLVFAHPVTGRRVRRVEDAQALQGRAQGGRRTRRSLSRSAPHVRREHGSRGRADADDSGVDGPREHHHDGDIRELLTGPDRGCRVGSEGVQRTRSGEPGRSARPVAAEASAHRSSIGANGRRCGTGCGRA